MDGAENSSVCPGFCGTGCPLQNVLKRFPYAVQIHEDHSGIQVNCPIKAPPPIPSGTLPFLYTALFHFRIKITTAAIINTKTERPNSVSRPYPAYTERELPSPVHFVSREAELNNCSQSYESECSAQFFLSLQLHTPEPVRLWWRRSSDLYFHASGQTAAQ